MRQSQEQINHGPEMTPSLPAETQKRILDMRHKVGSIIVSGGLGLIAINGPCAQTDNYAQIHQEGTQLDELNNVHPNLVLLQRLPPYKPRSNPLDWHGQETTDPDGSLNNLTERTIFGSNLAFEIRNRDHFKRYLHLPALIWSGGRSVDDDQLMRKLATYDQSISIGVKNGIDGQLEPAIAQVKLIQSLRSPGSAPAILIYRGGENATTPESWEKMYKRALELTEGRLIVDVAHGTEMAHDKDFKKSIIGQIKAMDHVIELAKVNYAPRGIMIEASDTKSPTDPHMPFHLALQGTLDLASIML